MSKHIRHKHPEHTPGKRTSRLPCPFPDDPHGWSFVKRKVGICIQTDLRRKHKWTFPGDLAVLEAQNCNAKRHSLGKLVYAKWRSMGKTDDAGGFVSSGGLKLRAHALFQLSLDRKNNARPHFIGNSLDNLFFVVLGINTSANIVSRWGSDTCSKLRALVMAQVTEADVEDILQREKNNRSPSLALASEKTPGKNVVYASCMAIFHKDKATRAQFEDSRAFFEYAYTLLADQRARCSTSTILMSEHRYTDSMAFQPSFDAIVPSKNHVKGNLRWVCAFLNSTDRSKGNKNPDGEPQSWTPALFRKYIGL